MLPIHPVSYPNKERPKINFSFWPHEDITAHIWACLQTCHERFCFIINHTELSHSRQTEQCTWLNNNSSNSNSFFLRNMGLMRFWLSEWYFRLKFCGFFTVAFGLFVFFQFKMEFWLKFVHFLGVLGRIYVVFDLKKFRSSFKENLDLNLLTWLLKFWVLDKFKDLVGFKSRLENYQEGMHKLRITNLSSPVLNFR